MCVDVSHLVLETLGNTNDQVVNESSDSTESGNVLSGTVVQFDLDDILLWVGEVDCQMAEVLGELACIPLSEFPPALYLDLCTHTSWSFNGDLS